MPRVMPSLELRRQEDADRNSVALLGKLAAYYNGKKRRTTNNAGFRVQSSRFMTPDNPFRPPGRSWTRSTEKTRTIRSVLLFARLSREEKTSS
jgi:hypothetical protein